VNTDAPARFPPEGFVLRGRSSNSVALWLVSILAGIVLVSDLVVALQWLFRGQPGSPLFVFAGTVLGISTILLAGTIALAIFGVRRQQYSIGPEGLTVGAGRRASTVQWPEIRAVSRQYQRSPGGGTMGVAVFVVRPERFASIRLAAEHVREYGTPIYLDLTDVNGGTLRFFAAVRHYSAGRGSIVLD
jgi:hypothetical protein